MRLLPAVAALVFAVAAPVSPAQHFTPAHKLQFAERVIENFYVDTVNANKLVEEGIIAMLKTLDPHSQYSTPEETRELNEPLKGNFSGIGIQFNMSTDTVYVIQTVAGGPSERVGIISGDKIIAADDTVIAGKKMRNTEVMKYLRGPKGSEVKLTVVRRGEAEPLEFKVTRDDIPIYSVDASYMAAPGVGYIRISRFAESTPREVRTAMKKLKKRGMKNIIIDLVDNGGGYLNAATSLAEMFLNKDDLIVYTKGLTAQPYYYRSTSNPVMKDGRLVVMVNQNSASASEIFAGAIQDHDRGVVVGCRTYGKGLVQRPFPMPDGSMIRLTVSRYYTPAGRCIQRPYTSGDREEYDREMLDRYNHGEFLSADSIHNNGKLFYTLKKGRATYDGGGITPDRFVPIDTTDYSNYYRDVVAKGVFNKFVLDYVDRNRAALKAKYPSEDAFVGQFKATDEMLAQMAQMAEAEGVKFDEAQQKKSRAAMLNALKAVIGRDLFDSGTYYRVANQRSPMFSEALSLILSDDYNKLLDSPSK